MLATSLHYTAAAHLTRHRHLDALRLVQASTAHPDGTTSSADDFIDSLVRLLSEASEWLQSIMHTEAAHSARLQLIEALHTAAGQAAAGTVRQLQHDLAIPAWLASVADVDPSNVRQVLGEAPTSSKGGGLDATTTAGSTHGSPASPYQPSGHLWTESRWTQLDTLLDQLAWIAQVCERYMRLAQSAQALGNAGQTSQEHGEQQPLAVAVQELLSKYVPLEQAYLRAQITRLLAQSAPVSAGVGHVQVLSWVDEVLFLCRRACQRAISSHVPFAAASVLHSALHALHEDVSPALQPSTRGAGGATTLHDIVPAQAWQAALRHPDMVWAWCGMERPPAVPPLLVQPGVSLLDVAAAYQGAEEGMDTARVSAMAGSLAHAQQTCGVSTVWLVCEYLSKLHESLRDDLVKVFPESPGSDKPRAEFVVGLNQLQELQAAWTRQRSATIQHWVMLLLRRVGAPVVAAFSAGVYQGQADLLDEVADPACQAVRTHLGAAGLAAALDTVPSGAAAAAVISLAGHISDKLVSAILPAQKFDEVGGLQLDVQVSTLAEVLCGLVPVHEPASARPALLPLRAASELLSLPTIQDAVSWRPAAPALTAGQAQALLSARSDGDTGAVRYVLGAWSRANAACVLPTA